MGLGELHVYGEELVQKLSWRDDLITRPTQLTIGLFDSTQLTVDDNTDINDITGAGAEPSNGNYTRQTVSIDSSDVAISKNSDGNWEIDLADQVFDTDSTTGMVNSYFVAAPFTSSEAGDSSSNLHIVFSDDASPERDLNGINEVTVDNARLDLD